MYGHVPCKLYSTSRLGGGSDAALSHVPSHAGWQPVQPWRLVFFNCRVTQVECADFVVLNKTDMLPNEEQLEQLVSIVSTLNPLATVIPCQQGKGRVLCCWKYLPMPKRRHGTPATMSWGVGPRGMSERENVAGAAPSRKSIPVHACRNCPSQYDVWHMDMLR
eukprot:364852-Chlamydomonas_euryale.AAC.9